MVFPPVSEAGVPTSLRVRVTPQSTGWSRAACRSARVDGSGATRCPKLPEDRRHGRLGGWDLRVDPGGPRWTGVVGGARPPPSRELRSGPSPCSTSTAGPTDLARSGRGMPRTRVGPAPKLEGATGRRSTAVVGPLTTWKRRAKLGGGEAEEWPAGLPRAARADSRNPPRSLVRLIRPP